MNNIPHANKSFWLAHSGEYTPSLPLKGSIDVDVVIIGGGFTGLSTAYHIRKADSSASVAVLEGECVAYGASGRTSGWVVPVPVLDPTTAKVLYGKERLTELQNFAWDGLDYVQDLIKRENMDSDFEMPGVTFTTFRGHERRLEQFTKYWHDQPRSRDSVFLDRAAVSEALNSDAFSGGCRMPHSGQVNPVKHSRELKRIAESAGAQIFEQTPVFDIEDKESFFILKTPEGEVRAKHIVLGTNGFTHLLPPELGLKRAQLPMFVYQLITEPLTDADWKALGWKQGQFYDKTTYCPPTCRTTIDGRLQFNLCDVYVGKGRSMDEAQKVQFYDAAERMYKKIFPAFQKLKVAQRWSGACSIPFDVRSQVGTLHNGRISYAYGYSGAGVMMSQNYGRVLADLALQRKTELTEHWFVATEEKGHAKFKRFPLIPGLIAALRTYFEYERVSALSRRRRLGLD
ncbi:FAD-binding oxidoreductase [Acinetobacter haemolyticus]|nr:FAD-binding oxidoreductase [Acinetobacter haemolyticus]